jgi:excisionase family DNA binding protein
VERGNERYLYVTTVAQSLRCSNQHVYNLITSGELEAIKIGKRAIRVTESSLIRFLEQSRVDPEALFE